MNRFFRQETPLRVSAAEAFAWHERPGAFERLAPPWEDLEVLEKSGGIANGGRLVFRVRMGPIWQKWVAEHDGYERGKMFRDRQASGPFAYWQHTHRFEDRPEGGSVLTDEVEYRLPLAPFSDVAPKCLVEDKISAMFRYRRAVMTADLERHAEARLAPSRIAITGASGLVGKALGGFLGGGGHTVVPMVRSPRAGAIHWDPSTGICDLAAAEGLDAVVHLAGESVLGLWTDEKKKRIRLSRTEGTRSLCESLARLERKPRVLVCASAIGFYGETGSAEVNEASPNGSGFLAEVAREWEAATAPARDAGIRVVIVRIGLVLSPQGGALRAMLPAFRFGIGGKLGDGKHYQSWIALDDLVYLFHHAIANEALSGPVNGTAPNPVTNAEFTRTLASVLNRFVGPPAPGTLIRLVVPEIAREMLLASQRVVPTRALDSGFRFQFPALDGALRHLLGRNAV